MTRVPTHIPTLTRARAAAVLAASGALVLLVAGCSGSTSASAGAPGSGAPVVQRRSGGVPVARTPGVSGLIAAWSNNTLQVQSSTAQTAVAVTSSTRITEDAGATAAAVTVGSCVTVRQAVPPAASTSSGDTPSPAVRTPSGPLTAATVLVRPAVNGSCTVAAGFPSGAFTPRARPSGAPSGVAPDSVFLALGATGKVTSVTAQGFVVAEDRSGTTSSVTVTTGPSTVFTTLRSAGRSAIHTGECALATGRSDSTGAVTAVSLVLSSPVRGSCPAPGFARGFQRNG